MARTKKTGEPKKPKITFTVDAAGPDQTVTATSDITNTLRKSLEERLTKTVKPQTIKRDLQAKYDRSKIAFSSKEYEPTYDGVETKGWRRLADSELRELSQVDPYISAIISTRCSQAAVVARPSDSKFDKGTRVSEIVPLVPDDFKTEEEFARAQKQRKIHMETILKWFQSCGTTNQSIIDAAFAGADNTFKFCSLPDFVTAQVRNLLTFGRCGTQIFRNDDSVPVMFRPVSIETIYNAAQGQDIHLASGREESSPQSAEDAKAYNLIENEDERPGAYIQRIDGQNVNAFTEDDLHVWNFQKQALFDLNGYMMSPIEMAIFMVFVHQQTLGYLRNQFVKGMATKGILNIQSTDPAAQLSDEDVEQLRREFHNFVSRNDNSAATPVISGPVKVEFISLSPAPQDMGFLQIEEHVVRALCSAFQVSPHEMGYGHLSVGTGGLTQANRQEEIIRGEERGLRMLLDTVYDGLNAILYENFPEAKDVYRLTYVGVGEDTRDAVVSRQQQELQTTATLSSLWADSEKTDPVPYGGGVPLAPLFHTNVVRYMKYGIFMEHFFGESGAANKPEYDFIIDPNLDAAYQRLKVTPIPVQQEETKLQLEQMEMQNQQGQQQMEMAQQQGQTQQAVAADGGSQASQPAEGQEQPPQEAEKSLREEFLGRQKLSKSIGNLFREWVNVNND